MIKKGKGKPRTEKNISDKTKVFIKTQILALIVYLLFFLIASIILFSTEIDKSKSFYAAISAFAAAAFICGYFSGYKIHKKGLYVGLLFCLPMNVIITMVSLIVNSFKVDLTTTISFVILIVCSMLGGVLSVNTKLKAK
ncbi:MAG: TIGR04086 family membrane protein [Faecalibacterium sp.]|nr:TIGR04086 family membrane protein [Ruminococcus sp.]MCM1392304.1 TIGR04086 family membrane protein [Ruminococcus sp.]MCM1484716.1 TIGR04086 family membrane protein [Faecalibacterium sp.]